MKKNAFRKTTLLPILFCSILLIIAYFPVLAEAEKTCTVSINPSHSIQKTVDSVQTGSVICLKEGRWKEQVGIKKSLTIKGKGAGAKIYAERVEKEEEKPLGELTVEELLTSNVVPSTIYILGKENQTFSVKLDNLTIGSKDMDLLTVSNASAEIVNCKFAPETQTGSSKIHLSNESDKIPRTFRILGSKIIRSDININGIYKNSIIKNTTISGAPLNGANISSTSGSAEITIKDSIIKDCGSGGASEAGIVASGRAHLNIVDTSLSHNSMDGLFLYGDAEATVESCRIEENKRNGISLWDTSQATIFDSTIKKNTGAGVSFASWSRLSGEEFKGNVLYQHDKYPSNIDAEIRGNTIVNNGGYGVVIYNTSCPFGYPSPWGMEFVGFWGEIKGSLNKIQDNGQRMAWGKTEVCPSKLAFLWATAGGRYPPKKE